MAKIKEKRNFKVYMHIIPKSISNYNYNKYYIGITCRKLEDRWGYNGDGYRYQPFYRAIKKYGWKNIKHKVIKRKLTEKEAKQLEIKLINEYDSIIGHKGYNVTKGGDGQLGFGSKPVYCHELKIAFNCPRTASEFTNEKEGTISNKCRRVEKIGIDYIIRKGYHWCFIEDIYMTQKNMQKTNNLVICIQNNKLYFSSSQAQKELQLSYSTIRQIISLDKYFKIKDKPYFNNKMRFLRLEDYLTIYDFVYAYNKEE